MTITVDDLGKLKYFTGVEMSRLAGFAQLFSKKAFIKGQTIVSEGDAQVYLHFVNSGVVKVFKTSSEGKEQIIKIVRPGESFNDIPVFGSGNSPSYPAPSINLLTSPHVR